MSEILKEWLTQRLQRTIKWNAEEFGDLMKNGYIIAEVLRSYHIINDENFFVIRTGDSSDVIKNNWRLLCIWLRDIEINLNDSELNNVMEGRGSALLRLFYQLFLHLDKKDRTDFIKRERKMVSKLVEKMTTRFKVDKISEEKEQVVDELSKPLLDERQYIDWQRKKAEQVKETYEYMRHKYSKTLAKITESQTPFQPSPPPVKKLPLKDKKAMDKFSLKYPCNFENYTYEDLLRLEEKAAERRKSLVGSEWTNDYLKNLHIRLHKKSDSIEFQRQLSNVVSTSMWDMTVADEECKLDIELTKKVMKLSQFEKQMCTQVMETKQQARNLVKNRIQSEKEFVEQRTQQFDQFLDNVKEEINLSLVEIDFEKRRQNMLHKRLYAEKMKRKRQHYYEICYETMLSIVDYATKYGYFKLLIGDDIPSHFIHEWKMLYFKQQPLFDILTPMEDLLKDKDNEEEVTPVEEIIRLELDRQDALNKGEFKEYHDYSYPWNLDLLIPNYDSESEERKYEYLGNRILGHVVYTLLQLKYPYPPTRLPADLPNFSAKALLCGLPDRSITVPMQTLLNLRKIHVVRLESAINFCLRKFKLEMVGCVDIELSFDKFMSNYQEEEEKELVRLMKVEDDILNKSNEANIMAISGPIPANVKQTQTPKTIPEEEIVLSDAANLGRYAYESLDSGDSLTDHLLAAIIVEYLRDQEDINGFVIINYPNSYRQAQILEETFSGRAPPDEDDLDDTDDIYLEESISKHRKTEKDPYKDVRVSKLVSDPHIKTSDKPFESYFSSYLKLKETDDILQQIFIWDLTKENSELIDRFYAALGINYSMYYEIIEKDFLAQICKYIIGDYSMPLQTCDSLFGENALSLLDFPNSDDKRTKSRIVKPEVSNVRSKDKVRRGSKNSRLSSNNTLEVIKEPEVTESISDEIVLMVEQVGEEDISSKSNISVEEVKMLAGEEDWVYGELTIPEGIGPALATCWEEIEKTYIHDMEQLFFAKRLQMNCVIPYTRFIKDKMEQIITLPSSKQDLVNSFQKEYNDFENDWRDVHLTKNEWHCRVKELQNRLYNICDDRKANAQNHRQALISDNWTMEELTTTMNTYISCLQTELNRAVLTFQLLHDFYFAMIKRSPPTERLSSKDLFRIVKESDETSGSKRGGEDKLYRQLKNAFQDLQMKNVEIDYSNNPLNAVLENNVKFALKVVKDINDSYRSLISKEYSEIAKITPATKRKDDMTSEESINLEEIFKENALKCIEEWTMGINGVMFRANLRITALQYKCYRDMKLFNDNIYRTFMEVQNDIDNYYMNEIKSVDRLCKYLQMAVEGGKRIPESLVLEQDTFIIDPNLLQFDSPEQPLEVGKIAESKEFKLSQLARLRSQLKIVAPTGIALQQAFIYCLQDFIFYGKESCEGPFFPDTWKRLDPEQVPKLIYLIFGETVYIDWRDFLIFCLNIRYPTTDELLHVRTSFRCKDPDSLELVSRDDFINTTFWFEEDFDPDDQNDELRKNLIKHFLFELFETSENVMNYSAFLLAFCKSTNSIEGFVTALSMAVGKKICYILKECEDVVCKLIKLKQYKDECLACARKCTQQFLDKVITNVINTCVGTTIIELEYTEPEPETDKKGKKGKTAAKAKKIESTHSARSSKMQKSGVMSRSKIQSATDVKTTFICRPCEEDAEVEDVKPEEKEAVEEEHKSEPQEDPNIIYAVSQPVIWNVLKICLPWHFQLLPEQKVTPYLEQVEMVMKLLETDTDNNDIYVCKFVSDPQVCKILHKVKKFDCINLPGLIESI